MHLNVKTLDETIRENRPGLTKSILALRAIDIDRYHNLDDNETAIDARNREVFSSSA